MLIFQNELTSLEFARLMGAGELRYHIIQYLGDSEMVKMVIAQGSLHA